MNKSTELLVGLGNPGSSYDKTRHNIGFRLIDIIGKEHGITSYVKRFESLMASFSLNNKRIILLKPQTYMNLSGAAVQKAACYFKISSQNVIVFHDDKDLVVTRIKMKQGGSNAGHNGLKSITSHLNNNYWRVRIGVGLPPDMIPTKNWVLSKFSKDDEIAMDKRLIEICNNLDTILQKDTSKLINNINKAAS